ncbi:16S rRNA processing protein RimM [Sphingomonas oleivorans]|uniref:Ribosome maturation factor RimM n=1 Tax=Sphingomonas oleivorans TaxID=1735121 RepID=A0A2T5FTW7_9SPHN|nr:ribosome maturation factor RimM [Sphingomonas oleivorans]PTQ07502.1 16S rRNA processing protein RimM [Sphingomonas oleivorans]
MPKAPTTFPPEAKALREAEPAVERLVTLAVIIGAHGVRGEVRLKLFTEDVSGLEAHQSFNGGTLTLKSVRDGSNGAIARFAEIADRTAAERLRGTELAVPRSALPPLAEGEYYHADLIGLRCVTDDGQEIGTAVAVENFGAGDILEIEKPDAKRFMVPIAVAVTIEPERLVVDAAFVE